MRGNLLDTRSDYEQTGGFASLDIGDTDRSTKWYHQPKHLKAWVYYGEIVLILVLSILCIIFAAGWAAANDTAVNESGSNPPSPAQKQDLPNVLLPIVPTYPNTTLMGQINTFQLINLLSGVYRIAMENGGNRAIAYPGHNATVEYLLKNIASSTNLVNVERTYFKANKDSQSSQRRLNVTIAGVPQPDITQFSVFTASKSKTDNATVQLLYVANPCDNSKWPTNKPQGAFWVISPYTPNSECRSPTRVTAAQLYGATGIVSVGQRSSLARGEIPWWLDFYGIGISGVDGEVIMNALTNGTAVTMIVNYVETHNTVVVSNICGDTPIGDPRSVVLVGGHSDGVAAGPGTNDDGSGSIATLLIAQGVTNLINAGVYNTTTLPNMIKFCWFGGEEDGLLGSIEVARQGLLNNNDPNARVGSRAKDWAVMIDLDMLGSMNYQNYIYDANNRIPSNTPTTAFNGSKTMTNLFFDFFKQNGLPSDSDAFDGRSDYGPFLEIGVGAGGVDAGADKTKNESTRVRYQDITGWGGVAGKINDQCYHKPCDTIENIHWGVYTNMTMSAAYVTEMFATRQNLRAWIDFPIPQSMPDPLGSKPFEFKSRPKHWVEDEEDCQLY